MTYEQFILAVQQKVEEGMGEEITVSCYEAVKNNGTVRKGLSFARRGINISPAIFLEEYYRQYCSGESLEELVSEILTLYREVEFRHAWDGSMVKEYGEIKKKIIYRLINRHSNMRLLEEVPHREILDLAIVYLVLVDVNAYGTATMLVRREHQKFWKVTEEELYIQAQKNTPELLKEEFREMSSMLGDMTGMPEEEWESPLYVLTNHIRSNGAAAILYQDCLRQIGRQLGKNYYALPSSVHEWIIVPEGTGPEEAELSAMVKEINDTQVEPEEVLADHAYFYNREEDRLSFRGE